MLQATIVLYIFIELPLIAFLATDKLKDGVHAWDSMVDVFLLLDFLVYFVTVFHSHDCFGQMHLNVNIQVIAVNYIHTGFMLDMAACLPWDKLARELSNSPLIASYLRLLKVTRIMHILFLAKILNEIVGRYAPGHPWVRPLYSAYNLGFFMFFFNHIISCFCTRPRTRRRRQRTARSQKTPNVVGRCTWVGIIPLPSRRAIPPPSIIVSRL